MICRKCGVKNKDTSTRCFHCGAPIVKKNIFNEIIETPVVEEKKTVIPEISVPSAKEDIDMEEYEILEEVEPIPEVFLEATDDDEVFEEAEVTEEEENVLYTGEDTEEDEEKIISSENEDILYTADNSENDVVEETEESAEDDVLYTGEDSIDAEETEEVAPEENADVLYVGDTVEIDETSETEETKEAEETPNTEDVEEKEEATDAKNISAIEAEAPDEEVEFTKKPNKKKLLWLLLIIPVIIILIIGYKFYNYLNTQPSASDNSTVAILKINEPEITKKTDENGDYIHAVFYGKAGDVLKIKCNDTSYSFTTDTVEFDLYLKDIFASDYVFTSDTVTVDLQAYHFRDKDYLLETAPITLSVPQINTDLSAENITIDFSETFDLSFWIDSEASATLNGEILTADVFGIINQPLSPTEEITSFEIKITKPYHQTFVKTITFEKTQSPINLTVSSAVEEIHSGVTVTLTYVADANASIYSNLPVIALSPSAETPGAFDVTLDLSTSPYGIVEAAITAKVGEDSVRKSVKFTYWPNEEELLATAQTFAPTILAQPEYDKNYTIDSVIFTETAGMYKLKGKVNDTELIFDIKDYVGEINFDVTYNAVAKLVNENDTPVFKLWYASEPEAPLPEGEEISE